MNFSKSNFPRSGFARGSRWLLILWLCLSLLTPGQRAAASAAVWAPNAAPIIDINLNLNLPLSTTATISDTLLHANDPVVPSARVFTIVTNVTSGVLELNSSPLTAGGTFTQQDISNGDVSYTAAATAGATTFTFQVSNGTETTTDQVYTIHINKAEPTLYPTVFTATAQSTSQIVTTWTDVPGAGAPDGYLVLCAPAAAPTPPTDSATAPSDDTACAVGGGSVHVPQGTGTLAWTGLNGETTYHFAIYPYAQTAYTPGPGSFYDYLTASGAPAQSAMTFLTYSIAGTVTDTLAAPIEGALVSTAGGQTALTGADGSYTLSVPAAGNYSVSASLGCYTFAPASNPVAVSDVTNHVTGIDFTGTLLPCIHGLVVVGSTPLAGVVVSDGASLSQTTGADGSYHLGVPSGFTGILTPSKTNTFFVPSQRSFTNVTADQYFQGFTAFKVPVQVRSFMAMWASTVGATGYYLDVATDAGFTTFVPGFQNKDVGNVTQFNVTGLAPHTIYYYQVRAHDATQTDDPSLPVTVMTGQPYFLPVVSR